MTINIIFQPISEDSPDLRFIEVEDQEGKSIRVGEWSEKDGFQVLTLEVQEKE
jgi:hypothetical protein